MLKEVAFAVTSFPTDAMSALVSVPPYGIREPSANYCNGTAREDGEDGNMHPMSTVRQYLQCKYWQLRYTRSPADCIPSPHFVFPSA